MPDQTPAPPPGQHPFTTGLLRWNEAENRRNMPWKGERDPYRIWLSEIILQQTRVEQGWAYYERFIQQFPTVEALAAAPDEAVFKAWEGLGYYSRCRNLLHTARFIAAERAGQFPDTYEGLLALKGVGPYTAAAIASFAFGRAEAVVDGNVQRVLARIEGCALPVDSTEGRRHFAARAAALLSHGQPGPYNQAIMDFGATVCTPRPHCAACFYQPHCAAFREGRQAELPVKGKRTEVKERYFIYLIVRQGERYAVRQRTGRDIWQGLFEFPLLEDHRSLSAAEVAARARLEYGLDLDGKDLTSRARGLQQRLTHRLVRFDIWEVGVGSGESGVGSGESGGASRQPAAGSWELPEGFRWADGAEVRALPFPRTLQEVVRAFVR